jgi:death on curing protein
VSGELEPVFLSTERVREIHREVVVSGVANHCETALLDSAVHAVESYAYYGDPDDVFDIAAAYAFYISEAQAFIEGNKRTALVACTDFLRLNGVPTECYYNPHLYDWMLDLANKRIDRKEFAARLRIPFE